MSEDQDEALAKFAASIGLDELEDGDFDDKKLDEIISNVKDFDFGEPVLNNNKEVVGAEWSRELFAIHIYHAVSYHLEKKGTGQVAQMLAVNKAIKDLTGLTDLFLAGFSFSSIKYSDRIDRWLIENGYADKQR